METSATTCSFWWFNSYPCPKTEGGRRIRRLWASSRLRRKGSQLGKLGVRTQVRQSQLGEALVPVTERILPPGGGGVLAVLIDSNHLANANSWTKHMAENLHVAEARPWTGCSSIAQSVGFKHVQTGLDLRLRLRALNLALGRKKSEFGHGIAQGQPHQQSGAARRDQGRHQGGDQRAGHEDVGRHRGQNDAPHQRRGDHHRHRHAEVQQATHGGRQGESPPGRHAAQQQGGAQGQQAHHPGRHPRKHLLLTLPRPPAQPAQPTRRPSPRAAQPGGQANPGAAPDARRTCRQGHAGPGRHAHMERSRAGTHPHGSSQARRSPNFRDLHGRPNSKAPRCCGKSTAEGQVCHPPHLLTSATASWNRPRTQGSRGALPPA